MRTRKNGGIIGKPILSGPNKRSGIFSPDDVTLAKQTEIPHSEDVHAASYDVRWDSNSDVDPYYTQVSSHWSDYTLTNHYLKDQSGNSFDDFNSSYGNAQSNLGITYYGPAYKDWCSVFVDDSYLQIQENADGTSFNDNPFTIEFWIKPERQDSTQRYIMGRGNQAGVTAGLGWVIGLNSSYQPFFYDAVTNVTLTSSAAIKIDQWNFVCICRNSIATNDTRIFVNGSITGTGTIAGRFDDSGATLFIGIDRVATVGATSVQSRMTDIRITGASVYGTSSFVTPTAPLPMTSTNLIYGLSMTSPSYDNIMGQVNSSIFTSSNFSTATYSVYFNSTSTSYYLYPNAVTNYGTSNFTAEMWVNFTVMPSTNTALFYCGNGTGATPKLYLYVTTSTSTSSQIGASISLTGGADVLPPTTVSMTRNNWYHVALVRYNSNLTIYVNGTAVSTTPNSTNLAGITSLYTYLGSGAPVDSGYPGYFRGWMSNVRFNNLTAVYTGPFAPPTAPLMAAQPAGTTNIQAITAGTTLLCCQSLWFQDNSGTGRTINQSGPPYIWAKNPFIATGTGLRNTWNNGSNSMGRKNDGPFYVPVNTLPRGPGYHSLSGQDNAGMFSVRDYRNTFTSVGKSLALGSGPFTVEAWINTAYNSDNTNNPMSIVSRGTSTVSAGNVGGGSGWAFYTYNRYLHWDDGANVIYSEAATQGASTYATPIVMGGWYHVAAVRTNTGVGGFAMYVNGMQVTSSTAQVSTNYNDQNLLHVLASRGNYNSNLYQNAAYRGFVTGLRISTTARYTGNFTFNNTSLMAYSHAVDTSTLYLSCTTLNDEPRLPFKYWKDYGVGPYSYGGAVFRNGNEMRLGSSHPPPNRGRGASWLFTDNSYNRLQAFVNTQQGNPNTEFNFGTGDFSIEVWYADGYVYDGQNAGQRYVFDMRDKWNDNGIAVRRANQRKLDVVSNNMVIFSENTHLLQTQTWIHICIQRTNGATALYLNGTKVQENMLLAGKQVGGMANSVTGYYFINFGNSSYPYIQYTTGMYGELGDFRVYKNVGAYGNYLTATGQLTTGTNPPAIPIPTGPINAGPTYATYFSNTSSFLYVTSSSFNVNNLNAWSVEMYVYPLPGTTATTIFSIGNGAAYSSVVNLQWVNTGSGTFSFIQGSGTGNINNIIAGGFTSSNWYHVAVNKDASYNIRMFVNGTQYGSTINSSVGLYTTTSNFTAVINGTYDNLRLGGNSQPVMISNVRWILGNALYTSNFTPPATGLTRFSNNSISNGGLPAGLGMIACNTSIITSDISGNNLLLQAGNSQYITQIPIGADPLATGWTPFIGDGNCVFLMNSPLQYDHSGRNNCVEWPWQEWNVQGNASGENVSMMSPYSGSQFPYPTNVSSQVGSVGFVSGTAGSWTSVVYNLQSTNNFNPGSVITATNITGSLGTGLNYVVTILDNSSVLVMSTGTQSPVSGNLGVVGTTDETSRLKITSGDNGTTNNNGWYLHSTFPNTSQHPELAWVTRLNTSWTIDWWMCPYWENPQGSITGYALFWTGQNGAGGSESFYAVFNQQAGVTGTGGATSAGTGFNCLDFHWNLAGPGTLTYLTGSTSYSAGAPPSINNPVWKQQSWMHVAVVYSTSSSTPLAMFWNGIRVATGTLTAGTRNQNYTDLQTSSGNYNMGPLRISNVARWQTTATTIQVPSSGWTWDQNTAVLVDQDHPLPDMARGEAGYTYGSQPSFRFKQFTNTNASLLLSQFDGMNWPGGQRLNMSYSSQQFSSPNGWQVSTRRGDWTAEMWACWWDTASGGLPIYQGSGQPEYGNVLMHISGQVWLGITQAGLWTLRWANSRNTNPQTYSAYSTVTTTVSVATATGLTLGTNALGKSFDHVVVQMKNQNIGLYVNGVEYGSLASANYGTFGVGGPSVNLDTDWISQSPSTAMDRYIGSEYYNTTQSNWHGFIQDIRFTRMARYTTRVINGVATMCYAGTNTPALPTQKLPTK